MDALHESCFAYPALRKFPINTKENVISSYGAYSMQKKAFDASRQAKIEENFAKAANFYGLTLKKRASAPKKRRKLLFKGASKGVSMSEITNKDELKAAVDFILDKRASVKRSELAEAAKYALWSASCANEDLSAPRYKKIAHIAGIGVGNREDIEKAFLKRAELVPTSSKGREAFWKYAKDIQELSDEDFYNEDTLNRICSAMDDIDFLYGCEGRHGKDLDYPEDVVFQDTVDDLCEQASNLVYVPSVDATLDKKELLGRSDAVNAFLQSHFSDYGPLEGEQLVKKVCSLDKDTALALLEEIDQEPSEE